MQLSTLLLAMVTSFAAAQTVTSSADSSSPSCAAQVTLDACIASIQGQINSCAQTDYSCLCTQYVNMLTCYANCPNDSDVATVQQQREQYCSAASVYGTTTTLGTAPVTSASTSAAVTDSSQSAVETGFAGASNTGASASPSATGSSSDNGAHGLEVARGLIAMGLAGLGLVL